jgi:hypothetical protein
MSAVTIESKKFPEGFPDDTNLRIEWVWGQTSHERYGRKFDSYKVRSLVWTGTVSGQFTRNFDDGKYIYKAHKTDVTGREQFRESGEFLVGMTQDQWMIISHMEPEMQKPILATDGVIFTCQFPACKKRTTSKISAMLHESKIHYGSDLLATDEPEEVKQQVDKQIKDTKMQIRTQKLEKQEATKIN